MRQSKKYFIPVLSAIIALSLGNMAQALGSKEKNKTTSRVSESDIQKHASDRSAILTFDKGSAAVPDAEKGKIRDLIAGIGVDNISRVEIAAWSDKVFPKTGSDLPKADSDLADQRAKHLSDYLREELNISTMRITTYNMAETSNWLARTFRTDEAELKSVFAKESVAPMARADFNVIAREGAPSKAIIVVVRK